MRSENDPGEETTPRHRSKGGINSSMILIVNVTDAAHWSRPKECGHKENSADVPAHFQLSLVWLKNL